MNPEERLARHRAHVREHSGESDPSDRVVDPTTRRAVITAGAAGIASSIAGCTSGEPSDESPGADDTTEPSVDDTTQADTAGPGDTYVVTNHTYVTSDIQNYVTNGFAQPCYGQRQFVPEQLVGFRVGVYDSLTGEILGSDTLDSVTLELDGPTDFDTLDLGWDGDNEEHPSDQWSARLRNTEGAEPGNYKYTIHVTNGAENIYDVGLAEDMFTFLEAKDIPTVTQTESDS